MERPSHTITTLQTAAGPRRMTVMGFSIGVQLAFLSLFVLGIATRTVIEKHDPFTVTPVEDVTPRTPPPPPPSDFKPVPTTATAPIIDIFDPPIGNGGITTVTPETAKPLPVTPPPPPTVAAVPDRDAAIIAESRTIPPYPPMERRLGMEGRVTLRLTVQPDGRVGQAEVVKSSGRPALDLAAREWITAHWSYRPAIRNGGVAASQVLAVVNFTLTNP